MKINCESEATKLHTHTQLWEIQTEIQLATSYEYRVIMIGLKHVDDVQFKTIKIARLKVLTV